MSLSVREGEWSRLGKEDDVVNGELRFIFHKGGISELYGIFEDVLEKDFLIQELLSDIINDRSSDGKKFTLADCDLVKE
jgi:hypothetical protein